MKNQKTPSQLPSGMTLDQYAQRYLKRQSLLDSKMAQNGAFTVADAAHFMSNHRTGEIITTAAMKSFLNTMVQDDLLTVSKRHKSNYYSINRNVSAKDGWNVTDSGIPIGLYFPCKAIAIHRGLDQ